MCVFVRVLAKVMIPMMLKLRGSTALHCYPRVQQTTLSLKNWVQTEVFVGHTGSVYCIFFSHSCDTSPNCSVRATIL